MSSLEIEVPTYGNTEIDTDCIDSESDIYAQIRDEFDLEDEDLDGLDFEIRYHDGLISCFVNFSSLDVEGFADARDSEINEDAIAAYIELFGDWDREDFHDRYEGVFPNGQEFACHFMSEEVPRYLQFYIDWDLVWRDLSHEIVETNDHYFRV